MNYFVVVLQKVVHMRQKQENTTAIASDCVSVAHHLVCTLLYWAIIMCRITLLSG